MKLERQPTMQTARQTSSIARHHLVGAKRGCYVVGMKKLIGLLVLCVVGCAAEAETADVDEAVDVKLTACRPDDDTSERCPVAPLYNDGNGKDHWAFFKGNLVATTGRK
jgi:hypothetical protein